MKIKYTRDHITPCSNLRELWEDIRAFANLIVSVCTRKCRWSDGYREAFKTYTVSVGAYLEHLGAYTPEGKGGLPERALDSLQMYCLQEQLDKEFGRKGVATVLNPIRFSEVTDEHGRNLLYDDRHSSMSKSSILLRVRGFSNIRKAVYLARTAFFVNGHKHTGHCKPSTSGHVW